ncbi:MAG: hypothetical protein EBY16_00770 [Gammaproteobacteria bacterium]|nr:hypothetical protein [Gammaproteobacteria bacterium]
MKEKLEKAFAEAWSNYHSHQSGYKPGFFTQWRHRSTSRKKEQLKTDFEIALANADTDTAHMEKLLAARLRNGSFNNGSFNNILINALQKNGIKEIDGQDLNDYRPPEKRIVKEQENIQLYRFDSRTLEQIQADGGFKPQQHSIFYDDILNLKNGSVGVSFTTDKQVAVAYMLKRVKKGLTDGALYTVKLSAEEAAMAFSLSKEQKQEEIVTCGFT